MVRKEALVATWLGREIQWLFSEGTGWVGSLGKRNEARLCLICIRLAVEVVGVFAYLVAVMLMQ